MKAFAFQTDRTFPGIGFDNFRRLSQKEVCHMESEPFWDLFCMTGEPLAYMLYRSVEGDSELPPIL